MYRELQEAHRDRGKSLTAFEQGSDLIKSCASEKILLAMKWRIRREKGRVWK